MAFVLPRHRSSADQFGGGLLLLAAETLANDRLGLAFIPRVDAEPAIKPRKFSIVEHDR